jgi:uncharacterized membrane protein HdeD (DUF308 family)
MIGTAVLYLIFAAAFVISSPLRLFADVVLPTEMVTSLTAASGYVGLINNFIPVGTLMLGLGILLAVEGYILIYKGIMWIIRKIPFVN